MQWYTILDKAGANDPLVDKYSSPTALLVIQS